MSELSLSRRTFIGSVGAGALVVPHAHAAGTPLAVMALLADGLDSPSAVHGQRVRLSWQLVSDRRGTEQKAYRIGVASSRDKAQAGSFDLWDSGRVESARSVDIAFGGPPLASRTRCHWTVTVWDDQGAQATSAVARWEMGLLSPSDWQGDWIAAESAIVRDDRLAGLPWMTGAQPQPGAGRSFRLVLDLPEPAELVVHSAVNRKPEAMLDGVALTYPVQHFAAMGPRPTYRSTHRVAAGRHVLSLFVAADRPDDVDPRAAVMVRATLSSGRILRFAGDRLRTAAGKPADWAAARVDERAWSPAVPIAGSGEAPMPGNGAFLLRRGFALREAPRAARLYVTALGAYLPFVNGEKVGDALLAPEWTDYRRHLLYRAYDVTALLKPGANLLGAMVGDGWYGSFTAPTGRWSYGKPPLRLRAQLEIEHADGRRETIATDDRWSVAPSMITASEIYNGEDVDARLDRPGWSAAGAALGPDWEPARAIETPLIAMLGASVQPIGAAQTLRPVKLTAIAPGSAVVDFGQNFAGWVRLRARGKAGQRITLRFAELLLPDGRVDQSNLRAARAADTWILRGEGVERFEPHFTYHGFRYVQIDGLGEPLAPGDVEGVVLHSTLPETGQLTLGQHVPQRLWQNALWSQRSNFFGIPTDCPQRDERLGWTGDAHVFWDAACFNMDAAAFTRKFLRDMRDAQRAGGDFPDIAPNSDIAHFTPPGSSPGWADAGIFLPWTSWRRYGDTAVIDEHWQAMARYLDSIHAGNPGLLWRTGRGNDFGDWLALDAKQPGDPTTPKDLVATAMWKGTADAMADMAAATGRRDDADRYRALADGIGRAFNAAFVRPDGSIGNGSQTGYILALHFGIVPPALRQAAADRLVADIVRRGTLLSTGFLGTPYSLDVLADAGRATLVYDLLLRTAFPSWGYMIAKNATTIWERWNGDVGDVAMNSFNHYALGAVAGFMFRRLAGIDPVEPGFARFRFDPVYDPRMPQGGGRYDSRVGRIETAWRQTPEGDFTLRLQVPANARCTLRLPARSPTQVREGGRALASVRGIERRSGDKVTLDVGGGRYDFTVSRADYG
ncbi:family 78 glycoside hydrolase catalytic domain [Sphingomonas sp. ac-8]|uniref:alpha-L-rhamnosidase n=1 Tax=Sphingomonas sp. ac-8 TaxID=3242977 RepID=UPI003A7F782E